MVDKTVKNLPVFQSVKNSLGYSFKHWKFLLVTIAPWLGLYVLFSLFFQMLGIVEYLDLTAELNATAELGEMSNRNVEELIVQLSFERDGLTSQLASWIQIYYAVDIFLHIMIFSRVAIVWHRAYLLGEMQPKISFGADEIYFILYFAGLTVMLFGFSIAAGGVIVGFDVSRVKFGLVIIISCLVLFSFATRFLMIFPGVAVGDKRMNPKTSWQITQGNGLDLYGGLLLIMLVSIPIFILKIYIAGLGLTTFVEWPLQLFLWSVCVVFLQVFLSISYRFFMPTPQSGDLQ